VFNIWEAFVLTLLWAWFVVPIFHLPELALWTAFGLSIVVSLLTHQSPSRRKGEEEEDREEKAREIAHLLVWGAIRPTAALGVGAIVHGLL